MELSVSIVIPTYNSENTIHKTIHACLSQDYSEGKLEIIIIDDGSMDSTAEIIKQYPVIYVYQENKGPAAARNLGWRSAAGEIICFTDSDCVPEREWVSKIQKEYTSETIGGVGGSYDIINGESLLATCIHEEIIQRHLKSPREVNYLGGFNVSYRRNVLKEVGGFNESYPDASGEDNELAYKIVKKGYKLIFDKNIKVGHYHPTKLSGYLKHQMKHGFWRMKLYRDHPDMSKGDVYAGLLDFIRPPLAVMVIITLPAVYFRPMAYLFAFLLALQIILQFLTSFPIVKRTKNPKFFYLTFVTFLRDYVRGIGMIMGIWKFRRRCK
jgi:glycosyltransferase involved in cell wall biosynthesis